MHPLLPHFSFDSNSKFCSKLSSENHDRDLEWCPLPYRPATGEQRRRRRLGHPHRWAPLKAAFRRPPAAI
eukprot:350551-Chlamydomonas_euryale.AAC.6